MSSKNVKRSNVVYIMELHIVPKKCADTFNQALKQTLNQIFMQAHIQAIE